MSLRSLPFACRAKSAGPLVGAVGASACSQLLVLVTGLFAARELGPEQRGYFALIVLIPSFFSILCSCGGPAAFTYFLASNPADASTTFRIAISLLRYQILTATLLSFFFSFLLTSGDTATVFRSAIIAAALPLALILQSYGLAMLQGLQQYRAFNISRILPQLLYTLLLLGWMQVFKTDLITFTGIITIASLLGALGIWVAIWCTAQPKLLPRSAVATITRRRFVSFGLRSFLSANSPIETMRVDQGVVGLLLAPVSLGYYVAAMSFSNAARFLTQSFGMIAVPAIASSSDRTLARKKTLYYTSLGSGVSILAVVPLFVLAPDLIVRLFGDEFLAALTATRLLLVAALLAGIRRLLADCLRGEGNPLVGSESEIVSLVMLLLCLPAFTYYFNFAGTAYAFVISATVSLLFLPARLRYRHRFKMIPIPRLLS